MFTEPLLNCRLSRKNYWQINIFSDLVIIEQKKSPYTLLTKANRKAITKMVRDMAN